jgi:hypothetical protein
MASGRMPLAQDPVVFARFRKGRATRATQAATGTTIADEARRTDKLPPGDLLGAMTVAAGMPGEAVG